MKLVSHTFEDGGAIPGRCAFAVRAPKNHIRFADNRNPHLSWRDAPAGTQSFVVLCTDSDAPTKDKDVNQIGREIPADLKRTEFVHWLMVNVPADVRAIAEGACSSEVTAKGKTGPKGPEGSEQGANDYTGWFKSDKNMAGTYLGYDGPCPPWNDSLIHHYMFEVAAVDLKTLPLKKGFTIADVRKALEGHVLAKAALTGRYSLNPRIDLNHTALKYVRKPSRVFGRKIGNKQGAV